MNRNTDHPSRPRERSGVRAKAGRRGAPVRRRQSRRARPAPGLKRFKRDEVSTILVNSAVILAALAVLLGLFFVARPALQLNRAVRLARAGDPARAEAYLARLERDGRSPKRISDVRAQLIDRYIGEGDFDAALSLTGQLSDGETARTLERRANYARASALYAAGDYEAAAQLFYALGDYEDARDRYAESRCAMAVSAWIDGNESQARYLLLDTDGAQNHIESAALAVTRDPAFVREILSTELFSPASLEQMARDKQAVSAARAQPAPHRLAAGYRHTAGLRSDGTVVATGDNEHGQCDVSGWTDIVEIAAGAAHTVGLRSDGTVTAAGDDSYGQCDVSGWTGVRAVAASAYGTFGLRSDGTVVATRSYADRVAGWHDVTQIAAGAYSAGGLYGQGSMACTHEGARLDMGASLFGLSVCGTVGAALLPDGSLYSNVAAAPDWHGLTQVAVSQSGMIGVFSDGGCRGFTFRDGRDVALNIDGRVIEAASGGTHHVVLTDDGRVFAFGDDGDGQCDVGDWQL